MKIIFIILICNIFLYSCMFSYLEKPNNNFKTLINQSQIKPTNKLKFDGVYHQFVSSDYHHGVDYKNGKPTRFIDTPFVGRPIFFFTNGLLAFDNALSLDSLTFLKSNELFGTQKKSYINNWGVYNISNDTVKAIIYLTAMQTGSPRFQCNFEGIIKNSDTILQWHLISPFNKILLEPQNKYDFNFLISPRNLYFRKVPINKIIDPSKAWINEFREDNKVKKK